MFQGSGVQIGSKRWEFDKNKAVSKIEVKVAEFLSEKPFI